MDQETALVVRAWVEKKLHAWFKAATEIHRLGGYLGKTFASSPRGYRAGKLSHVKGNRPFSWHYSALGIDIDQAATSWDGTINPKTGVRFVLEEDGPKFRVWCYADPQPPVPQDAADDKKIRISNAATGTLRPSPSPLAKSSRPRGPWIPVPCSTSVARKRTSPRWPRPLDGGMMNSPPCRRAHGLLAESPKHSRSILVTFSKFTEFTSTN
ncbi:uncharacterized protein STAUR_0195 [Stigmatella aurantiaca DW4/3-1]|uniref:Uncharacterized protein n=1 Tax=Stigmatella aurantiaca (strain DW4/3-1) TaxID=378806 RepID=E3FM00_STIAD|nr:uncharacterized protein STAUR_0195 [Stigmatella aurantiaca DW4/3-1]